MAKKTRIAVLILILLLVGGKLGWDQYEKYQAEQAALILQEQLAEEARLAAEQAAEEAEPQVSFLEVYRQTNSDTVAYLDMPGVSISYHISRIFVNTFFQKVFDAVLVFQAAYLVYSARRLLSTPFYLFCNKYISNLKSVVFS